MGQSVGVVDIFVASEATENRLAKQAGQQMPGVLAAPSIRQRLPGEIGQRKGVVELAVGQQTGVGSDPAAVELQPQAAVEIDPLGQHHPIHPLGVPCTRTLSVHNVLKIIADSAFTYKKIWLHLGNSGLISSSTID
jgi:hypothetical protein